MATFVMLGQYTSDSIKQISSERTDQALDFVRRQGGKVIDGYALLGEKDLLLIVEAKNVEQVMKISVGLTNLLGISFTTSPAISFDEFDRLMKDLTQD
jgi:uncharacterized protein with GYD domain